MTGTHETYWWEAPTSASHVAPAPASRGQVPRTLALPPGWPTGKVLTDGPSSGNRPSLESRPFWFSRASAPPRPALFTPASPHRIGAFCRALRKMSPSCFRAPGAICCRCVQESRFGRLGFRVAPAARILPESRNPGWGASLRTCVRPTPILGALPATSSVPECNPYTGKDP